MEYYKRLVTLLLPFSCKNKCLFAVLVLVSLLLACSKPKEHIAPAIRDKDSVAMMTSYGVNTLISDSGVIKYRIITEKWEVNTNRNPSRWLFEKALFLEQFDENFHVNSYIQCDTAYYFDQMRLWELRGRVRILTKDGLRFSSEQLFWDENKHELYSNVYSRLITPTRQLEGRYFRSDEKMQRYYVSNTKGTFIREDLVGQQDTSRTSSDTINPIYIRQRSMPRMKSDVQ